MVSANAVPQRSRFKRQLRRIAVAQSSGIARQSRTPSTYEYALAHGWKVVDDKTPMLHDKQEGRKGVVTMKRGGALLAVEYNATATGYDYAAPQLPGE